MKMLVSHPVPVRWRPARSNNDRVAYRVETTAVELAETDRRAFARTVDSGVLYWSHRTYHLHDGGVWLRIGGRHLRNQGGDPAGKDAPVTLAELSAFLRMRPRGVPHDGLARWGTPLSGDPLISSSEPATTGIDMKASTLALAREDHTEAARAALVDLFARDLATDGTHAYMRTTPPVMTPGADTPAAIAIPYYLTRGPSFPPHADREMAAYLAVAGMDPDDAPVLALRALPRLDPGLWGERDLAQFVNGAGTILARQSLRIAGRLRELGREVPRGIGDAFAAMTPLTDLGLVGAIPRARWAEAVDRLDATAAVLADAVPESYRPGSLPWLRSYLWCVARPRIEATAAPVPAEDAEAIGELAP